MKQEHNPIAATSLTASRIVFGTFGFAFAGVGISVLAFLWLTPFNQFGSPPLFFRIFGSFIALVFVVMGGTTFLGALAAGRLLDRSNHLSSEVERVAENSSTTSVTPLTYSCSKCGAHLGKQAEVSPLGDVKCSFCHQWFNIHQPSVEP